MAARFPKPTAKQNVSLLLLLFQKSKHCNLGMSRRSMNNLSEFAMQLQMSAYSKQRQGGAKERTSGGQMTARSGRRSRILQTWQYRGSDLSLMGQERILILFSAFCLWGPEAWLQSTSHCYEQRINKKGRDAAENLPGPRSIWKVFWNPFYYYITSRSTFDIRPWLLKEAATGRRIQPNDCKLGSRGIKCCISVKVMLMVGRLEQQLQSFLTRSLSEAEVPEKLEPTWKLFWFLFFT